MKPVFSLLRRKGYMSIVYLDDTLLLGRFAINVYFPAERKIEKVLDSVSKVLRQKSTTIQNLAETLGVLVSTFPAVELGPLYYRKAESLKIQALKHAKGDFAARLTLTSDVISELHWWLNIANHASKAIEPRSIDKYLCSDASKLGWALVDEYSMKTATGE
ncbi:hypothetical protein QYM36_019532 [Artemia franciscana]|uniref:Uncharacterized protein n=1 Tax=Artemia franciscana TaxID=6661 RepID=A0AA88H7R4_ARTSF|nr:hypothetical protein QYM36_019532 [Artemia franciscana]